MFAALLFGFAQAIPLRLNDAAVISLLPEEFIRMIPYVVTIVAIAGFVGRVQPPEAAGRAYQGAGGTYVDIGMADIDWEHLRKRGAGGGGQGATPPTRGSPSAPPLWSTTVESITGCNVENASYGLGLCAECGLVSNLHASGGGRLVAVSCVHGDGELLTPCGRCRQLLLEAGGQELLVDAADGPRTLESTPARLVRARRPRSNTRRADGCRRGHQVKRDGGRLTDEQIEWFIDGYTDGNVARRASARPS